MLSDAMIADLRSVLQAQNHILRQIEQSLSSLETTVASQSADIRELQKLMDEIEASADLLEADDLADFDPDEIPRLYEARRAVVANELVQIGFSDWNSFVRQCQTYALHNGLDPLQPYEVLLTDEDLKQLKAESYDAQYRWDRWDYIFVGASGVLAALTDFLLVGIPKTLKTGAYAGQQAGLITPWLKQSNSNNATDWFTQWARNLDQQCKVPYDAMSFTQGQKIPGMYPKSHRLQSLGHDPVLGFVFGVLDIMRGSITGFSYDTLSGGTAFVHGKVWSNLDTVGLVEALLRHIGHLISDVATPMGLPAPFMTLVQGINAGSFGEKGSVGQLARWMYLNGYDFRHFLVSGITPATIEIILRAYLMLRHYAEYGETKFLLASHPKYRSMLLAAHSIASLGNAGKIALMQGNPLAINQAEWMALLRYLLPSIKYWALDKHRFRMEHMEQINEAVWNGLLENSRQLLSTVAVAEDSPAITLGKLAV
jgi:hypothetical protein